MASDGGDPTLLIVDDDEPLRSALGAAMGRRGYAVVLAATADEAVDAARRQPFEYALVDVRLAGASGVDLCAALRAIDDGTRIVMMTGYATIANAVAAVRAGAIDYLQKPVDAAACERALLGRTEAEGALEDVPSLDRVEWEYLQRVLSDCDGNVSEAARRLRLHRRSLQRKLARHPPRR